MSHLKIYAVCKSSLFRLWYFKSSGMNFIFLTDIRKIKFIAYIYIRFNKNLDEKSHLSAKTQADKHIHAVFLLTAEQR